jgi:hypothetical protein
VFVLSQAPAIINDVKANSSFEVKSGAIITVAEQPLLSALPL